MAILSYEEINALFPKLGHRALFKRNWEQWLRDMHPNVNNMDQSTSASESFSDLEAPVLSNMDTKKTDNTCQKAISLPSTSNAPSRPTNNKVQIGSAQNTTSRTTLEPAFPSPRHSRLSLCELLEESLEGRAILNKGPGPFNEIIRSKLCKIIGLQILNENPTTPVTSDVYVTWAHEIKNLFPNEHPSAYFYRSLRTGSRGVVNRVQGKLPDMVHNLRRRYRAENVLESQKKRFAPQNGTSEKNKKIITQTEGRRPSRDCDLVDPPNEQVTESLQWLKNSSDPWPMVEKKWIETANYRLMENKSSSAPSISNTLKLYPALSKPIGYLLLMKDFEVAYSSYVDGLKENYPLLKAAIFETAEKKTNKKDLDFRSLLDLKLSSEETSNLAGFLLLPQLLNVGFVKGQKKIWRPTKAEVRDAFILQVANECELHTALQSRKKKLSDFGLTLQPLIAIIGASLESVTSYFVIVDQVKYRLPDIVSAVDTCFKIMWSLNAQYPHEAQNVWYFIQVSCYKLRTELDQLSTSVNALLLEVGIDL